jgi:transposase-like protein
VAVKKSTEIPEAKIRQVLWMLKVGKTKKACCEHLGINYNTKKLQSILDEFAEQQEREANLKALAKAKVFTQDEKLQIAKDYVDGEAQSSIAKRFHISPQKVKSFLIELNVPIRGRGKNSVAKVEHIVQDLEVKFNKGDKVFIPKGSVFAIVDEVYDEEWVYKHRDPIRCRYVELHPLKDARLKFGDEYEGKEDIHYNVYWEYENEAPWKQFAIKNMINYVEEVLESTGREIYRLKVLGDNSRLITVNRHNIYPVMVSNGS